MNICQKFDSYFIVKIFFKVLLIFVKKYLNIVYKRGVISTVVKINYAEELC